MSYLIKLKAILGDDIRQVPLIIFSFLLLGVLDIAGIGLIVPYISVVIDPDHMPQINEIFENFFWFGNSPDQIVFNLSFFLMAIFILKFILTIIVNKTIFKFSEFQQVKIKTALMQSYQNSSYEEYSRQDVSDQINTIQKLSNIYAGQGVLPLIRIIGETIIIVMICTFLAIQDFLVLISLISLLGITIFVNDTFFKEKLKAYGAKINKAMAQTTQGIKEGLEGFIELKIYKKNNFFLNIIKKNSANQALYGSKYLLLLITPKLLIELCLISFIVINVLYSYQSSNEGKDILSTLAMFGVAAIRLFPSSNLISQSIVQLRYSEDSINKLYEDLIGYSSLEINKAVNKEYKFDTFNQFVISNLNYAYPGTNKNILEEISLNFSKGDMIAFTGESGSGKTTLINIILGILNPQSGLIEVNGTPLSQIKIQWQSKIAYMPQEIFVINDSILKNITLEEDENKIDYEKLERALNFSKFNNVLPKIKHGLRTNVGQRGTRLSGGQRQRLALARAFYHERDVFIFDEMTSALDIETENEIIKELDIIKGKKTIILITHRLSILEKCDKVFKVANGSIKKINNPSNGNKSEN